jgi:spermidine synthase
VALTRFQRFKSYLLPQRLARYTSPINGEIDVYTYWGQPSVRIGGLTQSGGLVKLVWQQAFQSAQNQHFFTTSPNKGLILGNGAGTVAGLIHQLWPNTKLTGIEIDPVMVQIRQQYFPNVPTNIILADAFTWLESNSNQYDLIIVDLFQGASLPALLSTPKFIHNLHQSLSAQGCAIFNIFALTSHASHAQKIYALLQQKFTHVCKLHTVSNWIMLVSKSPSSG